MYMEYDIAIIGGGPAGYTDKNSFILRQDTRQYQKCLQIWYSGDERPKFRLGKDYRPEEQDRP